MRVVALTTPTGKMLKGPDRHIGTLCAANYATVSIQCAIEGAASAEVRYQVFPGRFAFSRDLRRCCFVAERIHRLPAAVVKERMHLATWAMERFHAGNQRSFWASSVTASGSPWARSTKLPPLIQPPCVAGLLLGE